MWRWLTQPRRAVRHVIFLSIASLTCGAISIAALMTSLILSALSPGSQTSPRETIITLAIEAFLLLGLLAILGIMIRMVLNSERNNRPPPTER